MHETQGTQRCYPGISLLSGEEEAKAKLYKLLPANKANISAEDGSHDLHDI